MPPASVITSGGHGLDERLIVSVIDAPRAGARLPVRRCPECRGVQVVFRIRTGRTSLALRLSPRRRVLARVGAGRSVQVMVCLPSEGM